MLRTIALTIAIAALSGGTALGQTVRAPLPDQPTAAWLVKHDKDDNGHGRKLGHYKHRGSGDENDDDNGARSTTTRRMNRDGTTTTTTTTTTTRRSSTNPGGQYYGGPWYGGSYGAPSYPPPYLPGY